MLCLQETYTLHIACTAEQPWAARYDIWLLIELTPEGVVFSFLSQLNKLACHYCLDQQLLFPHHHPNDHASQQTLYKICLYRKCLIQKTIQCNIMSILVDLILLSHLQSWLVSESLAAIASAAANCVEAAQALGCFGHLSQIIPISGLRYHSA